MNNSSNASTAPGTAAASVSQAENYFFSAFNFVGLAVNTLVIVLINRRGVVPGRIPRLFLLNFFVGSTLCCLVRSFTWLTDRDFSVPDDLFGTILCKLFFTPSLYYSFLHASFTNTILLSIERYMAVVHPMKHRNLKPLVNAIAIGLSWALGFGRQVNNFWRVQRRDVKCTVIVLDPLFYKVYGSFVYTLSFIAPLVVMALCDGRVIWTLRRQTSKMSGTAHSAADRSSNLRRKVLRELSYAVCITGLAHFLLEGPISNAYLLTVTNIYVFDPRSRLYLAFTGLSCTFYVITPFVYLVFMRSLRRAAARTLCCTCKRDELDGDASTVAATTSKKETSSIVVDGKF